METMGDRILTAIYCDDVRHEVGEKMSFMGCYQGELNVTTAPVVLPKLCIYATLLTPKDRPIRRVKWSVLLNDETEIAWMEISPEDLGKIVIKPDATSSQMAMHTVLTFAPYLIEQSSMLRVVAETEEGKITGPRLLINVTSQTPQADITQPVVEPVVAKAGKPRKKSTKA